MPAVFVHGVPDTFRMWDRVRAHLSRTDVITPALPGFDAALPAGFDATKEAYANWLLEQLDAIGEPVDLVGHDWGSILVQRVASQRPEAIRTLACGSGPIDRTYVWHDMAQAWQTAGVGEEVMEGFTPDALAAALAEFTDAEAAAETARHIDDRMKRCILTLYRSAVNVGDEWQDAVDAVGGRFPALVLWGSDDAYVGTDMGERLAQRLQARLLVFDGSGHWWPYTRPAESAVALEALWARGG
jgi:pimeloyl-ACP methyl ester carboxylesterase